MQPGRKSTELTYKGGEGQREEKQEVVEFRKEMGEKDKACRNAGSYKE